MNAVAPGGTLLVVSHDLEPMRAPVDTAQHSRPFDPDAYVRVEDFAVTLADSPDWSIEVHETRPRPPGSASAAHHVDDTVLRATADGTIAALNGAVGEVLAPSAGTTPLAPGSTGAIPGADTPTSPAAGTVSRPGGTQFLVLDNVDTFEVVVPFEESDAVRVSPNQRVDVRFDAVPDLTLPGNVVAVSPSASALSGVISYYVTVGLSQSDPRLRNGQTAQASVVTSELRDVLAVPNTAIRRQGGRTQVTVQRFDGQQVVDITPGVVGDTYTQVLSGLSAGDEVVVPNGR
jgi:HlyD family secretion protein